MVKKWMILSLTLICFVMGTTLDAMSQEKTQSTSKTKTVKKVSQKSKGTYKKKRYVKRKKGKGPDIRVLTSDETHAKYYNLPDDGINALETYRE